MKVYADDLKQVANNTFRMTLYGNGDVATAKAAFFPNGVFEGKNIAQGSAYVDTTKFKVTLYDEENNTWGG